MSRESDELGGELLVLARGAIAERLGAPPRTVTEKEALRGPGASFVTLMRNGALRGCIGSLEAHRPLGEDVRCNAVAAAFHDPRFPPLDAGELVELRVEVSLLTPAEPMAFSDEAHAMAQLRPGIDGVIFSRGPHRATFLPQVWESLPAPREFLAQLKRKAGLPATYWGEDVKLARYQVMKWKETSTTAAA